MEELWVAIAYKREDRARLLAETCRDVKGNKKRNRVKKINMNKFVKQKRSLIT